MRLEWYIARRYLASRRGARFLSLITLIAIGGIAIGVTALIVVTSVMTGLQTELRDKILGANPHVWLTTYGLDMKVENWPGILERVEAIPGVEAAGPFVHMEVGLSHRAGHAEGAVLRGVDPDAPGPAVTQLGERIRSGELELGRTASGHPPLLVGRRLADRFSLFGGEVVNLISFRDFRVSPAGFPIPRVGQFEVVGRFETGMHEHDSAFLYTRLEPAQELAGLGQAVSAIEIRVPDPMQADRIGRRIEQELGYPFRAEDWMTTNAALFAALQLEKVAMEIILLLIVVVAAFNIVSTLVMVVTDKTREIGILKSMGLTSRQVRRLFVLQGLVIGVVGATLGSLGGFVLTWALDRYEFIRIPGEIYFIDYLPVAVNPLDIGIILGATLLISLLATIYPATQAARLAPVDAIRHD